MRELSYKLKNIKLLDYANNLIFIVFGITLLFLTLSNLIYLFILSIYLIFLFKKNKKIFWLCLVLILIILIIYLIYSYDDNFRYTSIRGKIIDVTKYEEYSKYIIRVNNHKVLLYDYDDYNLKVGMIVSIKGNIKDTDTLFTPNAFDYTKYLKNNRIFYALTIKDCTVIKNGFSMGILRSILINYFDKYYSTESSSFLKALLVGYSNSLDEDFYTSLKDNGTLHLFAISGLHVSFFTTILSKGLTKIKVKEKVSEVILIIFLIIYVFITNFSASILRASLMYSLNLISKKAKLYLSSIDICSLSFIILVIINPLIAYSNGFILSYLVSFTIIMVSPLVASFKQSTQIFSISVASSIASLPVIININYKINLLTPLINVLFIGLVTLIMLPLSIIVAFISPLDYLYTPLVKGFMMVSEAISKYINLNLRLPHFSPIIIIIYYLIIGLLCIARSKKAQIKRIIILIIYLLILNNISLFKPYGEIYFLDLYYGESTVIFSSFKNSVVVIDTGDGTNEVLTNFLKSKGVKRIECLIITHNHSDHYGEINSLYNNFKIDNLIISDVDNYNYGYDLEKVKAGDIIDLRRFSLDVVSPYASHTDINDDSLILKGNINNIDILFMGDATSTAEAEIKAIDFGNVDILKIGHHGSSTSSSTSFINKVRPKNAVIMNGRVKKFNFPSSAVLNRLADAGINTYYTKKSKTIWVRSFMGKFSFYSLA